MKSKIRHLQSLALFIFLTLCAPQGAWAGLCYLDDLTAERLMEIARQPDEDLALEHLKQICDEINVLKQRAQNGERDQLTGLLNRHGAERYWRERDESGKQTFVAFLDIDHFKSVNDIYGHEVGDEVLARVAEILKSNLRENDMVFRWGGEEFGIILEAKSTQEVEGFLNRLKNIVKAETFRATPLPKPNDVTPPVEKEFYRSISIGVVKPEKIQVALKEILSEADKALYVAKENRDKVVLGCSEALEAGPVSDNEPDL